MKRLYTFKDELTAQFGCRVQRVALDAGFTCPNRDGSLGVGGCAFCGERGSAATGTLSGHALVDQIAHSKEYLRTKFRAEKFLAYFQAYTNTYAPIEELEMLYRSALSDPDIVGMLVGTRPDCLPEEVVALLQSMAKQTYLWVELGMQSMHDQTLLRINRGHTHAITVSAIDRLQQAGIRVCLHLILGLPGESHDMMMQSVREVTRLGVAGVKLHHLHVTRGSQFEKDYLAGELNLMDRETYVSTVVDAIELLDPSIVVHRVMGDGRKDLIAPDWSRRKLEVLNMIEAELIRRGSRQGSRLPVV